MSILCTLFKSRTSIIRIKKLNPSTYDRKSNLLLISNPHPTYLSYPLSTRSSAVPIHSFPSQLLSMNNDILTDEQNDLKYNVISFFSSLIPIMSRLDGSDQDMDNLRQTMDQLNQLFLLVVVGEFNSGKSSFLNALLGSTWLDEGVTPTTIQANILRWDPSPSPSPRHPFTTSTKKNAAIELFLPVPWLKHISIVDTPGTNAVIKEHQHITEQFIPRADMILFITSVDRPFSESERLFLEYIKEYKKNVVIILSKIDTLVQKEDLDEICRFIRHQMISAFGFDPQILPISSVLCKRAKKNLEKEVSLSKDREKIMSIEEQEQWLNDNNDWGQSNFRELEKYILTHLNTRERARIKLQSPLGNAQFMIDQYRKKWTHRTQSNQEDLDILENIQRDTDQFIKTMSKESESYQLRIDKLLDDMLERSNHFFNQQLVLTNAWQLVQTEKMKKMFDREVVNDLDGQVDELIHEWVDWMIGKQYRFSNQMVDYAMTRQAMAQEKYRDPIILDNGSMKTSVEFRREMMGGWRRRTKMAMESGWNQPMAVEEMSSTIKKTIYHTMAIEFGLVGIGSWIMLPMLDLSGFIGLGLLAAIGVVLLPYKRKVIQDKWINQIGKMRLRLRQALKSYVDKELYRGRDELNEQLGPYIRFVEREKMKIEQGWQDLNKASSTINQLRDEIDKVFGGGYREMDQYR